jgi:hypothetical protein
MEISENHHSSSNLYGSDDPRPYGPEQAIHSLRMVSVLNCHLLMQEFCKDERVQLGSQTAN